MRVAQKTNILWIVALALFDTLSNYVAYAVLAFRIGSVYATPMLVALLVSMALQALMTHFGTKEGPVAILGAFFGFFPLINGMNIIFELPARPGALSSLMAFGISRATQTSAESIPCAVLQALALIEHRSILQWISLVFSVFNIGYAVTSVDYYIDTSKSYRAQEPVLHGYYPPGAKGAALFASIALFAFGYVTAKLVAVAVLGAVAGIWLVIFLLAESIGLFLVRVAIGNWRWYAAAGDSVCFSLAAHFIVICPLMAAAPFPFFRHPFFLTPVVYTSFVVWTLFLANPLMLAFAFRYFGMPFSTSRWVVWGVLGSATALSTLSALVACVLMQPNFRNTFYRHQTMSRHVCEHWARETNANGEQIACNAELDAIRANALRDTAKAYWPVDLAQRWLREGWAQWLSHPPEWFADEWRARIPTEKWLATAGSNNNSRDYDGYGRASMSRQATASFHLAVDKWAPPWNLDPRGLETFLEEKYVNYQGATKHEKKMRRRIVHQLTTAGGLGILRNCCTSLAESSPWVQISHAANGKPLVGDKTRVKLLTSVLCEAGLAFYYALYVVSDSQSPIQGYDFVKSASTKKYHCELFGIVMTDLDFLRQPRVALRRIVNLNDDLLIPFEPPAPPPPPISLNRVARADNLSFVRNRQTAELATLTLTSFDKLEATQMAHENKTLSDIQTAANASSYAATLYNWGMIGNTVFILGEHCPGGKLVHRIKPDVGIDDDAEFWRLAFQLAQGIAEIHAAGLEHLDIQVSINMIKFMSF